MFGKVFIVLEGIFERIVISRSDIVLNIFIGVHQVDEFTQEESNLSQGGFPFILPVCKKFRHDITEEPCHDVDILLVFLFQQGYLFKFCRGFRDFLGVFSADLFIRE